jgi:hypothetical protein
MTISSAREMSEGNVEVNLDEVAGALSSEEYVEFSACMDIVQKILDRPNAMMGSEALVAAAKLAALRTKIGARAQYYKTTDKSIIQRRRKDLLMVMFTALEENINTLKLLGRVEAGMSSMR